MKWIRGLEWVWMRVEARHRVSLTTSPSSSREILSDRSDSWGIELLLVPLKVPGLRKSDLNICIEMSSLFSLFLCLWIWTVTLRELCGWIMVELMFIISWLHI